MAESQRKPRIRSGPTLGSKANVSVPISIGLPLLAIGVALVIGASSTGATLLWIAGGVSFVLGAVLFASGKTL